MTPVQSWRFGQVRVWQLPHQPGTRGEPQARELLAVELGVSLRESDAHVLVAVLAAASFIAALVFMWRSFYAMRIDAPMPTDADVDPLIDEEVADEPVA